LQESGFLLTFAVVLALANPRAGTAQAVPVTVPDSVGSFVLSESIPLDDGGVLLRYLDSGGINADLFITPPVPDLVEAAATDSIMLDMHSASFVESLKYGASRGYWEAYTMVLEPKPLVVQTPSGQMAGRESVFVFRRRGEVFVSIMRLFLVNGYFVKSRVSLPEQGWAESDKSQFGKQVMEKLGPVE